MLVYIKDCEMDTEKINTPLIEVLKARLRGEKDVSTKKFILAKIRSITG